MGRAFAASGAPLPAGAATLALPGLRVESVEWTEVTPGVQGIRVLQRLADDTPVELRFVDVALEAEVVQRRELADASDRPAVATQRLAEAGPPPQLLAAPLPEGWRQVVRPFRGGWMLIRGPLEESRLRALAEGVR